MLVLVVFGVLILGDGLVFHVWRDLRAQSRYIRVDERGGKWRLLLNLGTGRPVDDP